MNVLEGFYLKPLLDVSKDQLREYARSAPIEWREDVSNNDTKYRRNLIRLETIPALEQACNSEVALQSRLLNLADQSKDLNDWIVREVSLMWNACCVSSLAADH